MNRLRVIEGGGQRHRVMWDSVAFWVGYLTLLGAIAWLVVR